MSMAKKLQRMKKHIVRDETAAPVKHPQEKNPPLGCMGKSRC
ncbi:hypothetical protein [Domibacillus antri]|nr:hypothetical protein [Domibacillus antri]